MAECYLHFWLRFRVKYLRSDEQSLNLVVKNWNNKCRQIFKKKVIFLPEFPFNLLGLQAIVLVRRRPGHTQRNVGNAIGHACIGPLPYV